MSEMIQVPDGWEVKQSSELCSGIADGTHDTPQPSFFGFKLVTSKNLKDNKLDFEDCYLISEEDYNAINKRSQVNQFDILFGMIGTIGNPVIILDKKIDFAIKNVGLFRFNGDYELAKWFYYYLSSEQFKNYLDFILSGSSQKFVSLGMLRTLPILIPKEKKEQEKIAKILLTLDKAIESTNRLIEKEKNIKKALMQELLINGIDKDGHIRSPQTHTYKESELGLIPEEWEVDKLNEVTKLMTDFVANGSFESLADNVTVFETPDFAYYVRLVDIRKGLGHEKQTYVDELSFNFLKKSSLIGREILIANIGANVGETFLMPILNKPATIAPNMIVVKVNNKIIPEFLFYFLTFYKGISELQNVTEGSGQPKINKTKLKTINVLIPSIKEQEKIINILTIQDKKIETEETNLAKLKELKKGLMSDLLSGKVRVKV